MAIVEDAIREVPHHQALSGHVQEDQTGTDCEDGRFVDSHRRGYTPQAMDAEHSLSKQEL